MRLRIAECSCYRGFMMTQEWKRSWENDEQLRNTSCDMLRKKVRKNETKDCLDR